MQDSGTRDSVISNATERHGASSRNCASTKHALLVFKSEVHPTANMHLRNPITAIQHQRRCCSHPRFDHSGTVFPLKRRWTAVGSHAQYRTIDILSLLSGATLQRRIDILPLEVLLHSGCQTDGLVVSRLDRTSVAFVLCAGN